MDENLITLTGWANPPLYIPVSIPKDKMISCIWADKDGDLFVGIKNDSLIVIPGIAKRSPSDGEMNKEGNFILKDIISTTKKIFINGSPDVYAITNDIDGAVLLATSKGLARLKKTTGEIIFLGGNWNDKIKITNVQSDLDGNIWFGTV